jgi:hypothetical protein
VHQDQRPMLRTPLLAARAILFAARAILGAILLLGLLSGSLPFASVSSAPVCKLACCVGRPPHAAGSCMSGSCHTGLVLHPATSNHAHEHTGKDRAEPLCGPAKITTSAALLGMQEVPTVSSATEGRTADRSQSPRGGPEQRESVTTVVVVKPCQPDCGGCASGSTRHNRQSDLATLSYADRPRPPSSDQRAATSCEFAHNLDVLCRQSRPRAPPV